MSETSTAILFFSKTPLEEANTKKWFPTKLSRDNRHLAQILIGQTTKFLDKQKHVYHFHEGNQKGENFGERIANAYQELFDEGYQSVIAIGNDSPEVLGLNWEAIRNELESEKAVLGSTYRGGAYLIGICKKQFDKESFEKLPWQTNRLFESLYHDLESMGEELIIQLPVLRDINSQHDIRKLLGKADLVKEIKSLLADLVGSLVICLERTIILYIRTEWSYVALRAPPYSA